jgi:hypothetical protein
VLQRLTEFVEGGVVALADQSAEGVESLASDRRRHPASVRSGCDAAGLAQPLEPVLDRVLGHVEHVGQLPDRALAGSMGCDHAFPEIQL